MMQVATILVFNFMALLHWSKFLTSCCDGESLQLQGASACPHVSKWHDFQCSAPWYSKLAFLIKNLPRVVQGYLVGGHSWSVCCLAQRRHR